MKNFTLFLIIIFSATTQLFAQYSEWSDAAILTDTVSLNSNPTVMNIYPKDTTYMFYEKRTDSAAPSAIYFRDIQNITEEHPLLQSPEINYKNPYALSIFNQGLESQKVLVYLSDESGFYGIYYLYLNDDAEIVGDEHFLYNSDGNISSFKIFQSNNGKIITWVQNSSVYVAGLQVSQDSAYLVQTTMIDSGNCSNPNYTDARIYYQKTENDSSHIWYSKSLYSSSKPLSWSDPVPLDTVENCNGLTTTQISPGGWISNLDAGWESNGKIRLYGDDMDSVITITTPLGANAKVSQIAMLGYVFPRSFNMISAYFSFVSNEDGNNDIYSYYTFEGYNTVATNLSSNNLLNSNPRYLLGWSYHDDQTCSMALLDIWETHTTTGKKYLSMANTVIYLCGDVEEHTAESNMIKTIPNPFDARTAISFYHSSAQKAVISVYSVTGEKVRQFTPRNLSFGWNSIEWAPGQFLPAGIYLIELKDGENIYFTKTIKK